MSHMIYVLAKLSTSSELLPPLERHAMEKKDLGRKHKKTVRCLKEKLDDCEILKKQFLCNHKTDKIARYQRFTIFGKFRLYIKKAFRQERKESKTHLSQHGDHYNY